jgi:hypothetical protein
MQLKYLGGGPNAPAAWLPSAAAFTFVISGIRAGKPQAAHPIGSCTVVCDLGFSILKI